MISLANKQVFIKLADGSYLSRELIHKKQDIIESGVFYLLTKVHEENNSGSFFDSVEYSNIRDSHNYVIFSTCHETGKVIKTIYNEQTMWEGKIVEAKVCQTN